jgi:hypothetical protein
MHFSAMGHLMVYPVTSKGCDAEQGIDKSWKMKRDWLSL